MSYRHHNDYLDSQRKQRDQKETDERVNADISYFPFTHGDLVEKQRREYGEASKKEQQELFDKRMEEYERIK